MTTQEQPIDSVAAGKIIDHTCTPSIGRGSRIPDPATLMNAVETMVNEYRSRLVFDGQPNLQSYSQSFVELKNQCDKTRKLITDMMSDSNLAYFFLISVIDEKRLDPFGIEDELEGVVRDLAMVSKLMVRTEAEVSIASKDGQNRRWYEMAEGRAHHWLFGHGIPDLYEQLFGGRYSIPGQDTDSSPGLRFARAVIHTMTKAVKLPPTSDHNLRKYAQRRTKSRVIPDSDPLKK